MILVTIARRVTKDYVKFRTCLMMLELDRGESLLAGEEDVYSYNKALIDGALFVLGHEATQNDAKQLLASMVPVTVKDKVQMKSVASVAARGQGRAQKTSETNQ